MGAPARPSSDGKERLPSPATFEGPLPALALFLLALVPRAVYFFRLKDTSLLLQTWLDDAYYDAWAVKIAAGDWLGGVGPYVMSPGYSYFLAMVYKAAGHSVPLVVWIQFLSGAAVGVLLFRIGTRLGLSRGGAWAAGLLYALHSPAIFYEGALLKAALINVLNVGALWALVAWRASRARRHLCWAGALGGLSAHFRPNVLAVLGLAALWVWWSGGAGRGRGLAAFAFGAVLALVPVTLRNRWVAGEWVLTTAHGGMNFYTGNNPSTKGPYASLAFARSDPAFEQQDFIDEARRRAGRPLSVAETSGFWYREAFAFVRAHPGRWLRLMGNKFLLFWNDYEQPINANYYFFREKVPFLAAPFLLRFGPLAVLGLLGFLVSRREETFALPRLYLAGYVLTSVVFFVVSEYRFPVVPVLCLGAARGLEFLAGAVKRRAYGALGKAALFAAVLGAAVYRPAPGRATELGVAYNNYGANLLFDPSRREEAFAHFQRALRLAPDDADVHFNLGSYHMDLGDYPEAVRCLEAGLARKPDAMKGYFRQMLGDACLRAGATARGVEALEKTAADHPENWECDYLLGVHWFNAGRLDLAEGRFRESLRRDADAEKVRLGLALTLYRRGEAEEAWAELETLARRYPGSAPVFEARGDFSTFAGRYGDAAVDYEKALTLDALNPVLRAKRDEAERLSRRKSVRR